MTYTQVEANSEKKFLKDGILYIKKSDGTYEPWDGIDPSLKSGDAKVQIGAIQADYDESNPQGDSILIVSRKDDKVLQDAATSTGNGTPFDIGACRGGMVSLVGNNLTSCTIVFEVSDIDNNWTPIVAVRLSDLSAANQTTTVLTLTGEKWRVEFEDCIQFRTRIAAIAGTTGFYLTSKIRGGT